jgi:hypothetical protein
MNVTQRRRGCANAGLGDFSPLGKRTAPAPTVKSLAILD